MRTTKKAALSVADAELTLAEPRVFLNGKLEAAESSGGMSGAVTWLYLEGHGRFVLSLIPNDKLGFVRNGVVSRNDLLFHDRGEKFRVECDSRIAPGSGTYNLYVRQDRELRPGNGAPFRFNPDSLPLTPAVLLPYCRDCRDLSEWPERWMGEEKDLPVGRQLVEYFMPFLLHLAESGLSRRTIQNHVDNMWLLGGEIIRDVNEEPRLRKRSAEQFVRNAIQEDGGPLIQNSWEDVQRTFDSTCRKFYRFLTQPQR